MVKYSVDRIEANIAVLDSEGMKIEVEASLLGNSVREGDIVVENGEGIFIKDEEETDSLKKEQDISMFPIFWDTETPHHFIII